MPKLSISYKP
jgi:ATP-binding cassette, sub-family E, member 1